MNYIKHLTGFFERVIKDDRLNPTHISLYIALFQFWNVNRFVNPISISRGEVMRISKIASKATYHKCMKELHSYGYVRYDPSYNPFRGSLVHLMNFDDSENPPGTNKFKNRTTSKQPIDQSQTSDEQALVPSINTSNTTNISNDSNNENQIEMKMLERSGGKKEKGSVEKERKSVNGKTKDYSEPL